MLAVSQSLAAGPFGSIVVGNWKGGAYTSDTTGEFSHCAAGANYLSGIYFMVAVNAPGAWTLAFSHPSWELRAGEVIPIDLTCDGQSRFHVFGTVHTSKFVIVPMPNNSALIAQFRRSTLMTAFTKGTLFEFKLDSTAQLLPALANCVAQSKTAGVANAGNFVARPPARPAPPAPVPAVSSLRSDPPQPGASPELQFEAIELATNFVLQTGLQNPRVLSRSETPAEFASFGAAWKSDDAVGVVKIIPAQGNMKGIDVAATVATADSKECQGKFTSGRVSELVDSDVVFRGFATCEDSAGARFAQYFIVPRRKGGFVMFSVISNMNTDASRAVTQDEKRLVGFRRAALTASN
jgi:hypothetical protein